MRQILKLSVILFAATFISVSCKKEVENVSLDKTELMLKVGEQYSLVATVFPSNATDYTLKWVSANPSIATVNEGVVVAKMEGTTNIIVSAGANISASCLLTVSKQVIPDDDRFEDFSVTVNGVTFKMIAVEAGTFMMGAPGTFDPNSRFQPTPFSYPQHQVTLTKNYYIGETEVTQELWTAVMGNNPSFHKGNAKAPVEGMIKSYADYFIQQLNQKTGKKFRLPTEAEWEFACRGGLHSQDYLFSGSNNLDEVAWYWDRTNPTEPDALPPREVATKKPNELGIHDMSGNVSEYVNDYYAAYSSEPQIDPQGAENPPTDHIYVERGGAANRYIHSLILPAQVNEFSCSNRRFIITANDYSSYRGFRIACDAK
ncbi:MAG: SUMF1/EgtB/PvdO family nonheme iron enzyme [Bacteroidales bacterium]|jgi:formylglycine-generating enzyme required for sulfatase activity|nr:SUMF1/EgtB/PvdO family nonheme iron enzyme [Bacteroidales bacterium]